MEKITVAEAIIKNGWCNIKTNEGKEVSVMLDKALKCKAQIETQTNPDGSIRVPFELECKVVPKGDKTYAWDAEEKKPGGGFKGQPKDESLIAAQSCLGYACNLTAQSAKHDDVEYVLSVAEKFHAWVMKKKSK